MLGRQKQQMSTAAGSVWHVFDEPKDQKPCKGTRNVCTCTQTLTLTLSLTHTHTHKGTLMPFPRETPAQI